MLHLTIKKEIILISIALVSAFFGLLSVTSLLYISLLSIIVLQFLIGNKENFCVALFLIPCIRMFDNTGISFLVNILLCFPVFLCVFRNFKLNKNAFFCTFILVIIELLHNLFIGNLGDIISNISAILPLYFCIIILEDNDSSFDSKDICLLARSLGLGCIFSAITYLCCNLEYTKNIVTLVTRGLRFTAYANDPNYYSMYMLITISILLICSKNSKIDYIIVGLLIITGFLTGSKMYVLILIIVFTILFIQKSKMKGFSNSKKFFIGIIVFLTIIMIYEWDNVVVFYDFYLNRSGLNIAGKSTDYLTSGRSELQVGYIRFLFKSPFTLLLGAGFQYPDIIGGEASSMSNWIANYSHNTYLDIILSWGIIGTFIFVAVIWKNIGNNIWGKCASKKHERWLPLFILLLMFMALSCLSASMFWYIITLTFLVVKYV